MVLRHGINRVVILLMAAAFLFNIAACASDKQENVSAVESTTSSVTTTASAEATSVETPTSVDPLLSDDNFRLFKSIVETYGYTNPDGFSSTEMCMTYFDAASWDNFMMTVYESNDQAVANNVKNTLGEIYEITDEVNFNQFIPCTLTQYTQSDKMCYEVLFENYTVNICCDDSQKALEMAGSFLHLCCGTNIYELAEKRKVRFEEVEPEDTDKVYRLSDTAYPNTSDYSVFYIPAIPGLIAKDMYNNEPPLVGGKECAVSTVYFYNQFGDAIVEAVYERDATGDPSRGEPFDYEKVVKLDIKDASVTRFNTNIGTLNAEVFIRDYEDRNNKDLKKEVFFCFPSVKVVLTNRYRVEYLCIIYRCAELTEAFEFMENYVVNDILLEHDEPGIEETVHNLSELTNLWKENKRNREADIPHFDINTVDWREFISTLEPKEE